MDDDPDDCVKCGPDAHITVPRGEAVSVLAECWQQRSAWLVPVCGLRMIAVALYMAELGAVLVLDGEVKDEALLASPPVIGGLVATLPDHLPAETLAQLSGVYVIPRRVSPTEIMGVMGASPATEDPVTDATALLMLVAPEDTFVQLAPMILDVAMLADPKAADALMSMVSNSGT
jgi:hypothetical protein